MLLTARAQIYCIFEKERKKKGFFERDVPHGSWCQSVMETQAYKTYEH
jgi:hypothetical protein